MSSKRVIDLRGKKPGRTPPAGQQPLFSSRGSGELKRPLPLRAKRRRIVVLKLFVALLFLAALAWGIGFATYLPQFTIRTIEVEGAKTVPPDLVVRYAWTILDNGSYHYLSRSDIFFYPRAVLESAVETYFPRIVSAQIYRESFLSTTVHIRVIERDPFALWCEGSSTSTPCYEMDGGGFIFAQSGSDADSPTSAYIFRGDLALGTSTATSTVREPTNPIGHTYAPSHLPGMVVLLRLLGQAGFTPQGATVESLRDFVVPLAEGFSLKASFGENADTLVKNLQLVLSSDALQGKEGDLEYVDLRFGDRVYYKLKGQDQTTAQ